MPSKRSSRRPHGTGSFFEKNLKQDGKAKSYVSNRESVLKNHLAPSIGDMPVDEVQPKHLRRMKREIFAKGVGPSVVISALWLASGTFKHAMGKNSEATIRFRRSSSQSIGASPTKFWQ